MPFWPSMQEMADLVAGTPARPGTYSMVMVLSCQTLKELPQPQVVVALGFSMTKRAPCRSSR